jgi:hypothetical protein
VTVKDPFRPYVDGRHFRCGAESAGKTEPFGVCEGSDLKVQMHEGYQETGGYDLVEGMTRTGGSCCDDEKGTSYTCSPSPSSLFKYCKPGSMADPADAAVAKAVPPPAPVPKGATEGEGSDRPDSPLGDKDDDKWITEGLSKVDNKDVAPDPVPKPAPEPAAKEPAAKEPAPVPETEEAAEEAEAPADEAEEPAAEDEEEGAPVEAEDEAEEEAAPEEAAEEAAPEEEAAEEAAPEEEAAEEAAPEEEAAEEAAPEEEVAEEAAPEEEAAAEAAPPAPKK